MWFTAVTCKVKDLWGKEANPILIKTPVYVASFTQCHHGAFIWTHFRARESAVFIKTNAVDLFEV